MDIGEERLDPEDLLKEDNPKRWEIFVDGSVNSQGNRIGIVFVSPAGEIIVYCFRLEFETTNNEAEYKAVIEGLRLAVEMGLEDIRLTSDSQLVIRQLDGRYKINDLALQRYSQLAKKYTDRITSVIWRHIGRINNRHADALAFITSMMVNPGTRFIWIDSLRQPSIYIRGCAVEVINIENNTGSVENTNWRIQIHKYLQNGETPRDRLEAHKLKSRATNYELRDGVLYKRSFQGPLLRCLSPEEGIEIMKAIHYGDARNHNGTRSLALKTRGKGYYWPHMHEYAKDIATKCEECQRYGKRIHAPGRTLNSVLSVWPFAKWGLDIVGPLSENSTPLYPQRNGQAEATNKTLADILKKKLDGHHKGWCEQLHNTLWAYNTTRREATGMSPFCLTYGVEVVLPTEVIIPTTKRESWEKNLNTDLILKKLDDA
ncbi:uncharacterized protein LOC113332920 [Papaver somniferum]|uniref:uncharacterized protein LOC113332920 n=1 Tax=Papaver somniferum TaxID=3469 RepID=UPI000E6F4CAA|nr:uncharacterized protein LOC113332920 [Papaver somniferum]